MNREQRWLADGTRLLYESSRQPLIKIPILDKEQEESVKKSRKRKSRPRNSEPTPRPTS